jgi:hypothetical protein
MNEHIRVIVYKSEGWWIIHGLDYEFVTLARQLEEVPGEIRRWLSVLFAACRQLGVEPFHGYTAAPPRYWRMYEGAEPWAEPLSPLEPSRGFASGPALPVVDTRLAA